MKIAFPILIVTFICLAGACNKPELNKEEGPSGISVALETKNQNPASGIEKSHRTLFAFKYSGKGVWEKGINVKAGNQFFINIEKSKQIPVKIGERLEFKTAGVANIIAISRMEFKGYSSIFVIVDKSLSPDGDGYPNPIYIPEDGGK